jgi:pimeloyl-ACP methyl ester carboxylesterase
MITLPGGPASIIDEGTGIPIVALHGLPGSTRDFRWLAPCLTPHFRLIRVDLPGFGETPIETGNGFDLGARTDFVIAIMDALSLDKVVLMGHSIGGPLAMSAAVKRAGLVRGVALICSVGLRPHPVFRNFGRRKAARALASPIVRWVLMPRLRRSFIRAGFPRSVTDEAIAHSIRYAATTSYEDHVSLAEALSAPTLHAWAEDDRVLPPVFCRELAAACPDGPRLEFANGGHNLQKTMAQELGEAMGAWISEIE